jgi:hypothetical protein
MADELKFYAYRRSRAAAGAAPAGPHLKGHVDLTLAETSGGRRDTVPVDFLLVGPHEVSGLKPGAVRRTYPVNGAFNVETDKCSYVEFAAEDLPWRYTPQPNSPGIKPWLLLVVGTPEEAVLLPGNRVVLSEGLVAAYSSAGLNSKPHLWAHVQEHDGVRTARLLSPIALQPSRTYHAVLVPAFDENGTFQLPAGKPLPAYYSWRFTTSDTDKSFVDLAKRLHPLAPIPDNMGLAPFAYQTASDQETLQPQRLVGGALVGLSAGEPEDLPPEIRNHFAAIRPKADPQFEHDEDGRPLIRLPVYGEPWYTPGEDEPAWMEELNDDPRHRGIAGLGMWAGIEWQERIVDAASQQLGAFYTASRRIRQLTVGVAAARSLWDRRLPAEETHRLQVLAPAMSRMAAAGGGSVVKHVAAPNRPVPPAFFSSAARRLLRPGTARARLSKTGALAPAAIFECMNTCPPDKVEHPDGLLSADELCHGRLGEAVAAVLERGDNWELSTMDLEIANQLHQEEQREGEEFGIGDDESFFELFQAMREGGDMPRGVIDDLHAPYPRRPCETRPANLTVLVKILDQAMTPHGDDAFIIRRVLTTIDGLDDQPLTPPELCLDFHIPAWKFLNEFAKDWFLPGLGQLKIKKANAAGELVADLDKDPVIAAETNGRFTDAFLVGFNQQALAELRWRNVPVVAGCTPLRRFWEPLRPGPPVADGEDIVGIHNWQEDSDLGDSQHETPEAQGDNLVLIFKSQLWRRYPDTLIYLLPDENDAPDWEATPITPNLHVEIGRDVVAFGFVQDPTILNTHWVVIEQVPRGVNFFNVNKPEGQQANDKANGAEFAKTAFVRPVRVLISGTELQPQPG